MWGEERSQNFLQARAFIGPRLLAQPCHPPRLDLFLAMRRPRWEFTFSSALGPSSFKKRLKLPFIKYKACRGWSPDYWKVYVSCMLILLHVSTCCEPLFFLCCLPRVLCKRTQTRKTSLWTKEDPWKTLESMPNVTLNLKFKQNCCYYLLLLKGIPKPTLIYLQKEKMCLLGTLTIFWNDSFLIVLWINRLIRFIICMNTFHFSIWKLIYLSAFL